MTVAFVLSGLICALALTVLMAGAWLLQRRVGNAGWVDVFWTFGTGIGSVVLILFGPDYGRAPWERRAMLALLVGLWAARLGGYVAVRVAGLGREDVRYASFRREWGSDFQRRMFRFVIVQGPIAALLCICTMIAAAAPATFPSPGDAVGLVCCLGGLALEATADRQMRRFRTQPESGRTVCDVGLWRLSRHPNYLGEFLFWLGIPPVAIGSGEPIAGLFCLASPAMMYWLLVHVSGIPPLEQAMLASRGDAYRRYQERVPTLLPRLVRFRNTTR